MRVERLERSVESLVQEDLYSPKSSCRTFRNVVVDLPEAAKPEETALMEAIDNVGDFFRFVDWSNRSEISLGGCKYVAVSKPRRAEPHRNCGASIMRCRGA